MIYALLAYVSFQLTVMISTLNRANLLRWWGGKVVICFAVVLAVMLLILAVAKLIKRYDLIDAAWGLMFIAVAVTSYLLQYGGIYQFDTQFVVTLMVIVWGLRLSWHIVRRIIATKAEDPRYVDLRKNWKGNETLNVFFRIYFVQAVLALVISMSVIHINLFADTFIPTTWNNWTFAGIAVWAIGFLIESRADSQLRKFVRQPENAGQVMNRGLWKYSRHPNYFGELTQWWGIFVICLGTPVGWFGLIGPVILTYLILFVSGIPPSEKRSAERKGWAQYKASTSAIIPLPTRQ
jgi:steroid 5-alpha reductase family enzyme